MERRFAADQQVVGAARPGPSGGPGPWRNSGRRWRRRGRYQAQRLSSVCAFIERSGGAARRRVAAVQEGMQHDAPRGRASAAISTQAKICSSWLCTPPGDKQTHDVQRAAALLHPLESPVQRAVAGELTLLDGPVDPGEVLIDHSACTEVHVAHLGVAHLPVR